MDLATLWFFIVAFFFVGYFVLDGFDKKTKGGAEARKKKKAEITRKKCWIQKT